MSIGKSRKFVYYRYTNPDTKKEIVDNMPLSDWEDIQIDRTRKHQFEFVKQVDLDKPNAPEEKTPETEDKPLEIVEDELECPLCGFNSKSVAGLKKHKTSKHDG